MSQCPRESEIFKQLHHMYKVCKDAEEMQDLEKFAYKVAMYLPLFERYSMDASLSWDVRRNCVKRIADINRVCGMFDGLVGVFRMMYDPSKPYFYITVGQSEKMRIGLRVNIRK